MNEEKKEENTNETVSTQKTKTKRRFNWTPAKRAAFEKCIAARKQKLSNKEITADKKPEPPPKIDSPKPTKKHKKRKYVSSSDSESTASSSSSISLPPIRKSKLKRVIKRQIQKAFPTPNPMMYQQPLQPQPQQHPQRQQIQPQPQAHARPPLPRYMFV